MVSFLFGFFFFSSFLAFTRYFIRSPSPFSPVRGRGHTIEMLFGASAVQHPATGIQLANSKEEGIGKYKENYRIKWGKPLDPLEGIKERLALLTATRAAQC